MQQGIFSQMHYIANEPDPRLLNCGVVRQACCGLALKIAAIALICRVAYQEPKSG
jgi:hypothetical protein